MVEVITIIIIIIIYRLIATSTDRTFQNRTSPSNMETDHAAMNRDLTLTGDQQYVKEKFNRGGYDVPKGECYRKFKNNERF